LESRLTRGSVIELVSRPLTVAILLVPVAALLRPPLFRLLRRRAPQVSPASST
jgi:hypothetical protein